VLHTTARRFSVEPAERRLWLSKILVPVDFTAGSSVALRYAGDLAREFHATVVLLHVAQLSIIGEERGIPRASFVNDMQRAGERQLQELADLVCGPDADSEVEVREGRPHEEIVAAAREMNADLIIMASHGNSGLLRWLRPGTVERVICDAPCPVLALRAAQQRYVLQFSAAA
jgi:universal stress protein A